MADLKYFHNSLNEEETSELKRRMDKAKSDTYQVYELCKSYRYLSRRRGFYLYKEVYGKELQVEEVGRALTDLCLMGLLFDTGKTEMGDKGAKNKIYEYNPNPPENIVKIPKKICVDIEVIETEDGFKLDMDKMSQEFISKMDHYETLLLNKE